MVARISAGLGFPHATLRWTGEKPAGNRQAVARAARYRLLEAHAWATGAVALVTAHHQDDQIETHLLARRRNAGDRGLAGMRAARALAPGLLLLRPFLHVPGERLKASVRMRGLRAVEDPSNRDPRFDRARLRGELRAGGFDRNALLAAIAGHAARRSVDDQGVADLIAGLRTAGRFFLDDWGVAALDRAALAEHDPDLAAGFLARLLRAVGGAEHPPARSGIRRFLAALTEGGDATLGGVAMRGEGRVSLRREFGRTGPAILTPEGARGLFDARFEVLPPGGAPAFPPGSRVVPFGRLGRGGAAERTLPMLVSPDGRPCAAARPLLAKLPAGLPELPCRSRVAFRLEADLPPAHPATC